MLEEKRIGIEIYMIHDEIDITHISYSPDADIMVVAYTEYDKSYPKNHQDTGAGLRIEFITNKKAV